MRYPLRNTTIETISQAQVPVDLPRKRQLEIALDVAEQAMVLARAADLGDLWYRAWKRVEEVKAEITNGRHLWQGAGRSSGAQSIETVSASSTERH
jgi:hypothetical protein